MLRAAVKWAEFIAVQALAHLICLFPVRKNRVVCMSHRGASQYSDSPMYITEYLLEHFPGKYEIIWEFGDPGKFEYLKAKGIRTVRYSSLKEIFYLNTAGVAITNCGFRAYQVRRRHQLRINTWHGGGAYKAETLAGGDPETEGDPLSIRLRQRKINLNNVMLSSCRLATKYNIRRNFGFRGAVLKTGLPRNDIMFREDGELKHKVRGCFGIAQGEGMLLVAPTWRRDGSRESFDLDYRLLLEVLERKTGKPWKAVLRLHHLARASASDILERYGDILEDGTDYPDVQELLFSADLLITDYSSLIWDYALGGKPALLYTPDLELYKGGRGFNVPVEDWGFHCAGTEEELRDILGTVSMEELAADTARHLALFGSYERGSAARDTVSFIQRYMETEKK